MTMYAGDEFYDDEVTSGPVAPPPGRIACLCDDCECHDRAERWHELEPIEGLDGGWLCWNCAVGQHHEHDPLWCAP